MKTVANWGNYPKVDATLRRFRSADELREMVLAEGSVIARGLGRCYGDSSLAPTMLSTTAFNRILAFDGETGVVTCEAGVSFKDLLEVFVPSGWFLPVTPGTKFITVGGAVASDVHGKNHHKDGSFSHHVLNLTVMLAGGSTAVCSKETNPDLFWATCGGMGLTGVITSVTFRLMKIETAYILQDTKPAKNLDEIMDIFEASQNATYSVAWIDCLASNAAAGRSVMMSGEHAKPSDLPEPLRQKSLILAEKKKLNVPIAFPNFALNNLTIKAFNTAYYHTRRAATGQVIDYDTFFYPLDFIHNWNRIYGTRGFVQYQFVLPKEASKDGLKRILAKTSESGMKPFLAVLKLFGKQEGFVSFPKEGYTLAVDFPVTAGLFKFLDELDEIVLSYGGRLYMAKDARMKQPMFDGGYENAAAFRSRKHQFDADRKFQSLQSNRLEL
jgi:decaprenylphospho-beta-D-ribofuranose 2-oxidase